MAELSTEGTYGLKVLSESETPHVDIVFVHGLTGNRESTWAHKSAKVCWPKDILPQDLPDSRIITFGYDADIVNAIDTASSNTLRDHGKALALELARLRVRTKSERRSLIFVAHSLGGLVVEQSLLISRGAAQDYMKSILDSTFGILFMGTPHMGSDKAKWGSLLTRFSSLFRRTDREIVRVLEPGSEMLANLQQEFHTMLDDRMKNEGKDIEIFCFFEEIAVTGIGEIVPRHSAILPRYLNEGIHGTHTGMTKFTGSQDPGYISVSGQLIIWCNEIPKVDIPIQALRDKRLERFGNTGQTSQQWSGVTTTGEGSIVQGNISAGGNITM